MTKRKKKLGSKKYPFWFYVILFLLPFVIIILLETGFKNFNYGKDYSTFVKISDQFKDLLFFNPALPQKYFSSSVPAPSVIPDGFDKHKKDNTFRIFVLGGSTTAGFPYPPNASFPRFLKRKLQLIYPARKIEVINLGVSAVNTIFIRDIFDDVIKQKPDLIIFYAGHNEYYGAYGSASNDLTGYSTSAARVVLSLKDFKIYQLIINTIDDITGLIFPSNENQGSQTLMASMAGKNLVEYGSEVYHNGIKQFSENLQYILNECRKNNINVITSTLTSNLKHKPLGAITDSEHISGKIFSEAQMLYESRNYKKAKELLADAKEKDNLKFRAPEKVNEVIKSMSHKFGFPVLKIDSVFEAESVNGITGFNLFVDHLHPNIKGYKTMGTEFYKIIKEQKLISTDKNLEEKENDIDNYLQKEFPFSRLDSTYSQIKIDLLLNSYPFKKNFNLGTYFRNIKLENVADTFAFKAINRELSWEDAHVKLADHYYNQNDLYSFYKEINVLIEDKTFDRYPYVYAVEKLWQKKDYYLSKIVLLKLYKILPDKYTTSKLGFIFFEEGNLPAAIKFYTEAVKLDQKDSDLYFNLSKSYFKNRDLQKAFLYIKKCLDLSPYNNSARKIYEILLRTQVNN